MAKDRENGLSRDDILELGDKLRKVEPVSAPGVDRKFYIGQMSGAERDSYLQVFRTRPTNEDGSRNGSGLNGHILVRGLCDKDGTRLFELDEHELINGKLPTRIVDHLVEEIWRVNALGKEEAENIEGNSTTTPSDDSGSN